MFHELFVVRVIFNSDVEPERESCVHVDLYPVPDRFQIMTDPNTPPSRAKATKSSGQSESLLMP